MDLNSRLELIESVGEEIIGKEELLILLKSKKDVVAYDGFEPSGNIHIAQGLLRAINVNKLIKAGIKFKFWIGDWFALMNNKLGGDLEKIRITGEYFIEVWRACGMDLKNVEFLWASEHMDQDYWLKFVRIGTLNTVTRITRCAQIMGRSESEKLSAAQIFYPCMQATDIFHLKVDIAQLGMDQRKVNVLAREVAPKMGFKKPIAIHHHMLMGLIPQKNPDLNSVNASIAKKMSKSNPDSAIFMTDSKEEIFRKFKKAYCPKGEVFDNPVLEYCKFILFELIDELIIERPEKFGGNVSFSSYVDLESSFIKKKIHPMDLKNSTAKYINQILDPIRRHFKNGKAARLLKQVNAFKITK